MKRKQAIEYGKFKMESVHGTVSFLSLYMPVLFIALSR